MATFGLLIFFPVRVIPGGSPVLSITANGNGLEFPECGSWEDMVIHVDVSAFSGFTSVTLALQERDEVSAQWVALSPTPALAVINATGHQRVVLGKSVGLPFGGRLRLAWTVVGSGSCTLQVSAQVKTSSDPVPAG